MLAPALLLGFLDLSARAFSIQGPSIRHAGLEYVSSRQFARIEISVDFSSQVRSVKLYFRAEQYSDFYYVVMVRDDDRDRFIAILPIPAAETAAIIYFVEVVDTSFVPVRTPFFRAQVTAEVVSGPFESAPQNIDVGSTTPGGPDLPRGFRDDGIRNVIDFDGTLRRVSAPQASRPPENSGDGGGGGVAAAILIGAGAAAGAGYLIVNKQEEDAPPPPPSVPMADLSVTKTALVSGAVPAGTRFSYELSVRNGGPDSATNVQMNDSVPNALRITTIDPLPGITCGISGQIVQCSASSLNAGASLRARYEVVPRDAPVTITNRVSVSASEIDPNTSNNSASVTTSVGPPPSARGADLRLSKTTSLVGNARVGVPFSYQLQLTNGGPQNATRVELRDTVPASLKISSTRFPPGATCGVSAQVIRCSVQSLAVGAGLAVGYDVVPGAALTVTNSAAASASEQDPNSGNNTASVTTTVVSGTAPVADITVDVFSLGSYQFQVDLRNRGPTGTVPDIDLEVAATGVKVNFDPKTVTSSGFTAGCPRTSFTGGLFDCGTSLAPGQSARVTFRVSPTSEGTLRITARTLACESIDPDCKNNSDTVTTNVVFLRESRESESLSTAFSSSIETSSQQPVRGELLLNGQSLGPIASSSPRRVPVQARNGVSIVEAWTTGAASGEGRWEFAFDKSPHFAAGSLQVETGQVLSLSSDRVVFRLSGAPGERVRFRFRLGGED